MKKIFIILIAILVLNPIYSQQKRRTAIILYAKGTVEIFFADGTMKVNPNEKNKVLLKDTTIVGLEIREKDTLITGNDGLIRLVFNDGFISQINENSKVIIGSKSESTSVFANNYNRYLGKNDQIEMCSERVLASNLDDIDNLYRKFGMNEKGFNDSRLEIILPILPHGYIITSAPAFMFCDFIMGITEKQKYTLIIVDGLMKEVFRINIEEEPQKFIKYDFSEYLKFEPKDAHSVYYWDVFKSGNEPSDLENYNFRGKFYVLDKNKKWMVNSKIECCDEDLHSGKLDYNTYKLLVALYLKKEKLYTEAIEALEDFSKVIPDSPYPYEEIASVYSQLGDVDKYMVSKYLKKAESISQQK